MQNAEDGLESFFIAQQTYDKSKHPHSENSVSIDDFKTNGYGVLAVSMEKDQALNLSGLPINNSRVLELQATLKNFTTNVECVIFLEYIAVCRAWLDNTQVAI